MFQENDEKLDQGDLGMSDHLKLGFYQSTPHKTHQTNRPTRPTAPPPDPKVDQTNKANNTQTYGEKE